MSCSALAKPRYNLDLLSDCQLCPRRGEDEPVPGSYQQGRESSIAVVGERPGRDEGLLGRPFEDRAGLLLRKCMLLAGLRPEACLLTLLVRCAHDQPAKMSEVKLCRGWLWEELKAAKPRVVVALGKTAATVLTKNKSSDDLVAWPGGPVVLSAPSHHLLTTCGREGEQKMVAVLKQAKELACSVP